MWVSEGRVGRILGKVIGTHVGVSSLSGVLVDSVPGTAGGGVE